MLARGLGAIEGTAGNKRKRTNERDVGPGELMMRKNNRLGCSWVRQRERNWAYVGVLQTRVDDLSQGGGEGLDEENHLRGRRAPP